MKAKILYGTREGQPDYMEEILTEHENRFEDAKTWAKQNGFNRFRVAEIDLTTKPNFQKSITV